jgi:hydroxymethylglutaryl-CoA lyase
MDERPLPAKVEIVEVGPRDGLQTEPEVFPVHMKREFIERAIDAGLRRLEVASFVNPKRVPQMAGAEELLATLPRRDDVTYIGLLFNQRGLERAIDCGIDEVGMVVVASDTFNRKNQGVSTDESIDNWLAIAQGARAAGLRANVMISAAFGCPYEGEVALERVVEIARRVVAAEPVELAFADTIGVAVPTQIRRVIRAVRDVVGDVPLRCHLHNTRNTGLANAMAALEVGVTTLDASIAGIGGCPFAPNATGNVPTDDLLYMLGRSGIDTGVSLTKIVEISHWLADQLGRELPALVPKAGIFPDSLRAASS